MKRRTALGLMALAGCGGAEKMLSPRSKASYTWIGVWPPPSLSLNEIWVVPTSSGTQDGSQANPFATPTHVEFDALMRHYALVDPLIVHLNGGDFYTIGTREWDDYTNDVQQIHGFRMGRHWTFTSETNATLHWAFDAVPDDRVDDVPVWLILTTEARFDANLNNHSPVDAWNLRPRGQTVRNLTFDLQFPAASARWRAMGKKLRIGAVHLGGHQAAIEDSTVVKWGAARVENFPFYIQGATGKYDRDLIAQLDPAQYIYDAGVPDAQCSHITGCRTDEYVRLYHGPDENDLVTVRYIAGSIGERTPEQWIQHMRAFAYQTGNATYATGDNHVQAHTLYQCLRGKVANNYTRRVLVGYYGDSLATKGVEIRDNTFLSCFHGVQLLLSPLHPDTPGSEQFSHENYIIGPNDIRMREPGDPQQSPNVLLDTLGPSTETRYIRNISVDVNLTLVNRGATNVTRTSGYPPGPSIPVSIDGPTQIQPGATCTWYAVVGNGTAPYSYQWTASQMAPSSGSGYYFTGSKDSGSFATSWLLKVVVTDAVGGQGEHEITVYEDPSAMPCAF